jgi:hypothetical protein
LPTRRRAQTRERRAAVSGYPTGTTEVVGMDENRALRELAAELERDDPGLAARLTDAADTGSGSAPWWVLLLAGAPLLMSLFLLSEAAFGAAVLVLALAAPLIVGWLVGPPGGSAPPGPS